MLLLPALLRAQSVQPASRDEFVGQVSVHFDFAAYVLTPDAESQLLAFHDSFPLPKGGFLVVQAHTDSIGGTADNLELSRQRAVSVRDFLTRHGVPDSLVLLQARGEEMPLRPNASDAGRGQNRRATVSLFRRIPQLLLSWQVVDDISGLPLSEVLVVLHNKDGRDTLYTDHEGRFQRMFPLGMVTGVDVAAACYFPYSEMVKVDEKIPARQVRLERARTGAAADIKHLFFQGGLPLLLEQSRQELPRILRFLQLNPAISIEVAGHVNVPNEGPVPENHRDFRLSVARAKVVYDFLSGNGIAPDRISYRGYGNAMMRFPNAVSEAQQAANRRVEIRVVNSDCRWD
ncbi:MAG: hypothetical protein RLY31_2437 [Bacteroidota bacterium]